MSSRKKCVNIPESLVLEIDNLRSEVQILRQTVDSKSRAVVILRKQLASLKDNASIKECQDKQTQTECKNKANESGIGSPEREHLHSSNNVLAELLSISKRENKALKQDILGLRCKLHDALADLKAVRSETSLLVGGGSGGVAAVQGPLQQQWQRQERLHLISQLEALTDKVSTLTSDIRCLSADRDELLREREHNRLTVARLTDALRAASAQPPDAPSLPTKNLDPIENRAPSNASQACGSHLLSSSSTSEKLRRAEQEIARLQSVVADYELLTSLQRASHGSPRATHGSPHRGSGDDLRQAGATRAPLAVSADTKDLPLVADDNTTGHNADQEEADSYTSCPGQEMQSPTGSDDVRVTRYDEDCPTSVPDAQGSEKSSSQAVTQASDPAQDTSAAALHSTDELSESDRRLRATRTWLSRLEVTDEASNCNGYFESDFPEEIVPIEEIGAPRKTAPVLHTSTPRAPSTSADVKLACDGPASGGNEALVSAGAAGAGDDGGFSDYDSDDDNFEAELCQWQKSAGALLTKAQKKAE